MYPKSKKQKKNYKGKSKERKKLQTKKSTDSKKKENIFDEQEGNELEISKSIEDKDINTPINTTLNQEDIEMFIKNFKSYEFNEKKSNTKINKNNNRSLNTASDKMDIETKTINKLEHDNNLQLNSDKNDLYSSEEEEIYKINKENNESKMEKNSIL